ncbi:phosphoribosylanthranilate isomerase [Chryseobacterium indoltheticum]|uniref:phosphoribosylanthranilate isomerase n=1 Tax=Chryseobacterium indoltheticum TaxID=254 RepID=UPI0028EF18B4|nr:phosphoribosylanthranilate isomerase [Chryseobacterium indoltheticum]
MIENQQPSTENHQPKLKVCGLTQLSQIHELVALKIDFLGFIFYEKSPRYVLNHLGLDEISEINHQGKVGIFVNENADKIIEIAEKSGLNFVQLHGDESEDFILELRKKLKPEIGIIKVIRIGSDFVIPTKEKSLERFFTSLRSIQNDIAYILFDTDSKSFGGTGKSFDWDVLNEIKIPLPYFLSGGISLENFHKLSTINHQPTVLDINSKFEIEPGIKDLLKIKEFLSLIKY